MGGKAVSEIAKLQHELAATAKTDEQVETLFKRYESQVSPSVVAQAKAIYMEMAAEIKDEGSEEHKNFLVETDKLAKVWTGPGGTSPSEPPSSDLPLDTAAALHCCSLTQGLRTLQQLPAAVIGDRVSSGH